MICRDIKFVLLRYRLKMRILGAVALTTLTVSPAAFCRQRTHSPPALPRVTANALDKTKLTLPADFSDPFNLLILSFTRDQQDAVETWLPLARQLAKGNPKVQIWTLPVSSREDIFYKWWLNSSMRGSLPQDQPAHYTVPLYVNKSQFLKSLAIPSEKLIVVLLTGKDGVVLWRSKGPVTADNKASLAAFLKKLPAATH
jgi:hypothetical protein